MNERIIQYIDLILLSGNITPQQRNIIEQKAIELGENTAEVDRYISKRLLEEQTKTRSFDFLNDKKENIQNERATTFSKLSLFLGILGLFLLIYGFILCININIRGVLFMGCGGLFSKQIIKLIIFLFKK